jgi:hypothetical protein
LKQLAIISVLITYLALNLGISFNIHYCGEDVRSIDFYSQTENNCCEKKGTDSCCKYATAHLQSGEAQDLAKLIQLSIPDLASIAVLIPYYSFKNVLSEVMPNAQTHFAKLRSFLHSKIPLYLRIGVLRI